MAKKDKKTDKTHERIGAWVETHEVIKKAMETYEKNAGVSITKVEMLHKLVSIGMSTWDMTKEVKE